MCIRDRFSTLSSNRPNEYPFIIPNETLSGQFTPNEAGTPFFGASTRIVDNLYADMVYGGDTSEEWRAIFIRGKLSR